MNKLPKTYEQMTKRELIAFIATIRPKADAYDSVRQTLGIRNNLLGYAEQLVWALADAIACMAHLRCCRRCSEGDECLDYTGKLKLWKSLILHKEEGQP